MCPGPTVPDPPVVGGTTGSGIPGVGTTSSGS